MALWFLAENGAEIVVGHHPRVLQGIEWYKNVPLAYSLGEFLFNNSLPYVAERNFSRMALGIHAPEEVERGREKFGRGAILEVRISEEGKTISWFPFRQDSRLRPQLSYGEKLNEDLRRLNDLSFVLLDEKEPRHIIVEQVREKVRRKELEGLSFQYVLKRAMRPQVRHLVLGLWRLSSKFRKRIVNTHIF